MAKPVQSLRLLQIDYKNKKRINKQLVLINEIKKHQENKNKKYMNKPYLLTPHTFKKMIHLFKKVLPRKMAWQMPYLQTMIFTVK